MDAIHTERFDISYVDGPPILVGGSSGAALARAVRTIEAGGWRVADRMDLRSASERIDRQVAATAVWIELDRDCGEAMDGASTASATTFAKAASQRSFPPRQN